MWILFSMIVLFVVLDALSDATRDSKKKLSHLLQVLFILSALGTAITFATIYQQGGSWWKDALVLAGWYAANRLFLFNPIYNLTRGLPVGYIGTTSYWDIFLSKLLLKIKMPVNFYIFITFVIWVVVNGYIMYNYRF